MQNQELRKIAGQRMKGQYRDGVTVAGACLLAFLALLLVSFAAAGLLLRVRWIPTGLSPRFGALDVLLVVRFVLGLWLLTPLISGACWWFVQAAAGERNPLSCVLVIYRNRTLNQRAMRLYALLWLIAAIGWLPCLIAALAVQRFLTLSLSVADATWELFAALQLGVLGVLLFVWYLRLLLSVLPAMLLFATDPLAPAWTLIRRSYRLMKPRRGRAAVLLLRELLFCLPVITIVLRLPCIGVRAALFVREALREEKADAELERTGVCGAADAARNVSAGALRRVRPAPDEAQAPGRRHPLQRQAHPHD